MNTKDKLTNLFNTHAFTIDNGALLTSMYEEDFGIQIFEPQEDGNEFETVFLFEDLEKAEIFESHAMIRDDVSKEPVRVEFFSLTPVNLN